MAVVTITLQQEAEEVHAAIGEAVGGRNVLACVWSLVQYVEGALDQLDQSDPERAAVIRARLVAKLTGKLPPGFHPRAG